METITEFLIDWGYWGLFLSALIAGSVLPFSSEAVMVGLIPWDASSRPRWATRSAA